MKVKKPVRTIAGVTPLTVVTKPMDCPHGRCIYCPGNENIPNSYTSRSPAIMRALRLSYDPLRQVEARLRALTNMGHSTSKIEMIFLGGTFLAAPKDYQKEFVKACYDGLNGFESGSLEESQINNEKTENRCVAFCIETKPDWAFENDINRCLEFGCTRVELGIQLLDDEVYKNTNRGHTVSDVIKATKLLKDSGFKVGYHVMPGLPGSNPEKDLRLFKKIFEDDDFKPDQLKIYPCQVVEDTSLENMYNKGEYKPYDEDTIIKVVAEMKAVVPEYCRIMRFMRQFSSEHLKSGSRSSLRSPVREYMSKKGLKCKCIRCREIGFNKSNDNDVFIKVLKYKASKSKEFFISVENKDGILFGLCRARIPYEPFRAEISKDSLLIRELHVYGVESAVGVDDKGSFQHKGLGKKLMMKAEEIAKENNCKDIVVISGVGVREYYRKLGYERKGAYMVKVL